MFLCHSKSQSRGCRFSLVVLWTFEDTKYCHLAFLSFRLYDFARKKSRLMAGFIYGYLRESLSPRIARWPEQIFFVVGRPSCLFCSSVQWHPAPYTGQSFNAIFRDFFILNPFQLTFTMMCQKETAS